MQAPWQRMIALVDMNAFFASVEQRDNPYWRGRPIAITNGDKGSCIITCSYLHQSTFELPWQNLPSMLEGVLYRLCRWELSM